jgi:hypothetical protein
MWLALAMVTTAAWAQPSVSSSGAPTYAHPIAVAPGISGMEPKLALLYAGGGVNGPVGHGWSLQGLSVITRCPATRQTDGTPRGVRFDVSDKLCLDGQRLIQTDANAVVVAFPQTNDAQGLASGWREYRTEKDSFVRVRAYGTANGNAANGPAYFRVWTKAGQIYDYGAAPSVDAATTKALINAQGKSVAMVWAVARISDVSNNYIDFKYGDEVRPAQSWGSGTSRSNPLPGMEWNIQEIHYTGNSALSQGPTNRVVFRYSDRTADRSEAYQAGSKNVSVRRLNAIDNYINSPSSAGLGQFAGATFVRRIGLTYDTGPYSKRSRLISIRECVDEAQTRCQPPTRFSYAGTAGAQDNSGTFTSRSGFNLSSVDLLGNNGTAGVFVGDFNGDGLSDLMYWSDTPAQNKLYLSAGAAIFNTTAPTSLTSVQLQRSNGCSSAIPADFNGDGVTDVLRVMKSTGTGGVSCGTVTNLLLLAATDGSGTFTSATVPSTISLLTQTTTTIQHYDCLLPRSTGYVVGCQEPGDNFLGTSRTLGRNWYLIDFNGDGLLDIVTTLLPAHGMTLTPPSESSLCASQICTRLYRNNGSGTFTEVTGSNVANRSLYAAPATGNSAYVAYQKPYVSDLNGDGLADFDVSTGTWLSRGDAAGNFDQGTAGTQSTLGCGMPIDFNGDGRADCLGVSASAASQTLRLGDGTASDVKVAGFNLKSIGQEMLGFGTGGRQIVGVDVADFNGDGRTDILRWRDANDLLSNGNKLFLSQGDGTFLEVPFVLGSTRLEQSDANGVATHLVGDFSGSGSVEILRLSKFINGSTTTIFNALYVKDDPTPPDQMTGVTSPSRLGTTFLYGRPSERSSGRYVSDRTDPLNKATYPLVDLTINSPVVISMDTDAGVGTNRIRTEYAYRGLKAAVDGRGVLGFRQTVQGTKAPNGDDLTTWTTFLLQEPYAGVASEVRTARGAWNGSSLALLSRATSTYCDRTATVSATNTTPADPDSASSTAPCAFVGKVNRPYLRKSIEEGWDVDGTPLPTVTTVNTFNDFGDPVDISVKTVATVAGLSGQEYIKRTINTLCAPDSASCPSNLAGGTSPNKTAGDNWILGRVTRSEVTNTVPNLLNSITAGAGSAPTATLNSGNQIAGAPPSGAALVIIRMLLED